jgi:hypothetical protein
MGEVRLAAQDGEEARNATGPPPSAPGDGALQLLAKGPYILSAGQAIEPGFHFDRAGADTHRPGFLGLLKDMLSKGALKTLEGGA